MGPLSSAAGSLLPQSLGISSCDRREVQTQQLWYFPRVISQTLVCYPGTKPVIWVQIRGGRQSCPSAAGSHKPPGLCNGASPHLQFNQAASICPPSTQVGCRHLSTGSLWRSSYSLFPFPWWHEVCSPSPAAPNLVGTAEGGSMHLQGQASDPLPPQPWRAKPIQSAPELHQVQTSAELVQLPQLQCTRWGTWCCIFPSSPQLCFCPPACFNN